MVVIEPSALVVKEYEMRGKIIMWDGQKGLIAGSGQQHEFVIHHWRGDLTPQTGMTVELTDANGLLSVTPILEIDLAKEKLNKLSGKGVRMARGIFNDVGNDVAIAYGAFAIFALFLDYVIGKGFLAALSITLPVVLNGITLEGNGIFYVLIAIGSIIIPYFWKNKYASLALLSPLFITLYADFQLYRAFSLVSASMSVLPGSFSSLASFDLGIGAYGTLIVSAYIAFRGVQHYLRGN